MVLKCLGFSAGGIGRVCAHYCPAPPRVMAVVDAGKSMCTE